MSLGPSYLHDLVCNAGRYSPVGSAGCSCASRVPTFPLMTVEQLQAQIASLTAKIETLETAMLDIEKNATRAWFYWVANECKAQNALDFAEMVLARISAALQPKEENQ